MRRRKAARFAVAVALLLAASGCATAPYAYGPRAPMQPGSVQLEPGEPQFERGKPNALVDGLGWVVGIPNKILLLNIRVDNHVIGTNTEESLRAYLHANSLTNVKVRLNQYAPGGEWRRLFRNKAVGWGWRYTLGVLSCAFYTILPGRILGGDNYNGFTDTISIYSDIPAIALHEGGHAKDFAGREYKGTYAFLYALPFFALYPEALATGEAVGYLRETGTADQEKRAYWILYPAYGTYIGGSFADYIAPYNWVYVAGVIPGHIVGRWKGTTVEERRAEEAAQEDSRARTAAGDTP